MATLKDPHGRISHSEEYSLVDWLVNKHIPIKTGLSDDRSSGLSSFPGVSTASIWRINHMFRHIKIFVGKQYPQKIPAKYPQQSIPVQWLSIRTGLN